MQADSLQLVLSYLKKSRDYDVTHARSGNASNIIEGVTKNTKPLYLIVRSVDYSPYIRMNEESDEMKLLQEDSHNELWVVKREGLPKLITVGSLLKSNGYIKVG